MNSTLKYAEDIPICLDCIYSRGIVTDNKEYKFYCTKDMIEKAPDMKWNCFEPVTEKDLPF